MLVPMVILHGVGGGLTFPGSWLGFALASVVQVVVGGRFYRGASGELRSGRAGMNMLVAVGSSAAYGYSLFGLVFSGHGAYFMEAVEILTIIASGHALESYTSRKAQAAIEGLLRMAPETAIRLSGAGRDIAEEEIVPVSALRPGDRVLVRPGGRIPTDGEVIEGETSIDESMLTGESMPVVKSPGGAVYGGTVNGSGRVVVRIDRVGHETAIARIIETVRRAQSSKADIQQLADRVSGVFVPVVILIALTTFLGWGGMAGAGWGTGLIHATSVLIIACPCALGLATPAAIMAGVSVGARRGILIREAQALESSGRITAVVLDKTGTLTQGSPEVIDWVSFEGNDRDLLAVAAAIEGGAEHPLAEAIRRRARSEGIPLPEASSFRSHAGAGIRGRVGDREVLVGVPRWLETEGVDVGKAAERIGRMEENGLTVVAVATGGRLLGMIGLADRLKPEAADSVARLRRLGLEIHLLTGDRPRTAEAIAKAVGIDSSRVLSEVLPAEKAEWVKRLQQAGHRVVMVGDGINDAPALTQADLGIALGSGADIAAQSADLVLMRSDLADVPRAIELARATFRKIKQNLFFAFVYNAAAIPLAALGYFGDYGPLIASTAMGLSDVCVIGNALLLFRWRGEVDNRPSLRAIGA
jgi:Cu+-exporting ATPase